MTRGRARSQKRRNWYRRWRNLTAPQPILVLTGRQVTSKQTSPLRQAVPYLVIVLLAALASSAFTAYLRAERTIQAQADEIAQLTSERNRLSEQLAASRAEKRRWQDRATAAEGEVSDIAPALEETRQKLHRMRRERDALARTVDQLETDLAHHTQRGSGLARQLRQANDEIAQLKEKRRRLANQLAKSENRQAKLEAALADRKALLSETERALEKVRGQLEERTAQLASARTQRGKLKNTVAALKSDLTAALQGRNAQLRRWRKQRQARKAAEAKLAELRDKHAQVKERADQLATRLAAVSERTQTALARLTELTERRRETIQTALDGIDANIGQLAEQVRKDALPGGVGGPLEPDQALPPPSPDSPGSEPIAALKTRMADIDASADKLSRLQGLMGQLPLARPVDHYYVSSEFGYREDPFTGEQAMHAGLDLAGLANTPIYATAPGQVVKSGWSSAYGHQVVVDHGLGIKTRYAHLKARTVEAGESVGVRDLIGRMGSTGRSKDTHLHYEVQVNGQRLDPQQFIEAGSQICPL